MKKLFYLIRVIAAVFFGGALIFASNPVLAAEKKPKEKLAVLDLAAKHGVEKSFAEALSVIVRDKLHSFGEYQVMSKEDIQAVASREQFLQAMGSDDVGNTSLVNFGRAIGTRYMVAGDVSKLGSTYTVSLRMLDTQGEDAGVTNRVSETCKCSEDAMIVTVQDVTAKLVGKPTAATAAKKAEEIEQQRQVTIAAERRKAEAEQKRFVAEIEKLKKVKEQAAAEAEQKHIAQLLKKEDEAARFRSADEKALAKAMTTYLKSSRQGIEELTGQAKEGNFFSAMMLERKYRVGVGGAEKDELAAKRWKGEALKATASLERLAGKGDVIALSWLGNNCWDSEIPEEQAKALHYFEKAAKQGYVYAMARLGWIYEKGKGVSQDEIKSLEWYLKAAEKGYAPAMTAIGWMFDKGKGGIAKDEVKAVEWYRKSAEKGDALGMARFGYMCAQGKGGLTKDETKAVEWYKKAAEKGDALGMNNLGAAYHKGEGGLIQNDVKAVEWYKKAADKEHATGMANLGWMYETGKGGIAKDEVKAVEWYRKSADKGDAYGMSRLGYMYEMGGGNLVMDKDKAVEWYRKAGKDGNEWALNRLKQLGQ
jgi:TPR repeat protein